MNCEILSFYFSKHEFKICLYTEYFRNIKQFIPFVRTHCDTYIYINSDLYKIYINYIQSFLMQDEYSEFIIFQNNTYFRNIKKHCLE